MTAQKVSRKYDIGMNEYVGDTAFQQSESANSIKKGKENALSLSLKKLRTSSAPPPKRPRTTLQPISGNETAPARFDFGHYDEMSVPFVPKNTKKNNQWAYKRGLRIEITVIQISNVPRIFSTSRVHASLNSCLFLKCFSETIV